MSDAPFDGQLRLLDLLRALQDAGITFIVFGAVAVGLHGYVRGTSDLDVILEPSEDNLERAIRWLIRQDARLLRDQNIRVIELSNRLFRRGEGVTGIARTGRVVTAAAILLAVAIGALRTSVGVSEARPT